MIEKDREEGELIAAVEEHIDQVFDSLDVKHNIEHLNLVPLHSEPAVCPECGATLELVVEMDGAHYSPINFATGVPEDGKFHGRQRERVVCSYSPELHLIPEELSNRVLKELRTMADA